MQAIAPDFYTPLGGGSSRQKEDRAGDGLFDSLLREEEARYQKDAHSARERTEATRPIQEDSYDDYGRDEALRDEPIEEAREELPEQPADDYDASGESDPEADDGQAEIHEEPQAEASQDDDAPEATTADDGEDSSVATAAAPAEGEAAAAASEAGTPAAGPAKNGAPGAQQANAAAFIVPGQDTKANTPAGVNSDKAGPASAAKATPANAAAAAAQSAADPAATTEETTALPASAAAPAAKAAGKASETATSKAANPTAAAHRQSPAAPPAEPGSRPAAGTTTTAAAADQAVTVETTEGLSSRPSAALGGGSATAALAQKGETPTPATDKAKGESAATDLSPQAAAANKPAAQAGQAGKGQDIAAAAGDKAAQGLTQAATSGGSDGAGSSSQQPATTTPVTGAAPSAGGTVQNTSFAETLANARHGAAADPAEQIAVQVRRAQVAGQEQINIKLHPAELGRIEVKLESNNDGTLRAVISAERSETLDLLQRDARGLERALQEAGVKTDSGSLNFNLRGQNQGQEQQAGGDSAAGRGSFDSAAPNAEAGEPAQPAPPQAASYHDGALDIRV